MRDVLCMLKFKEDWQAMTSELPGYSYCFGNFRLSATLVFDRYYREVFFFSGVFQDSRTLAQVGFSVPLMVESFEQGTAWIVDGLLRQRIKLTESPA